MTGEITEAMVEAAGNELIGYGTDHDWFRCPATMAEFFEHDPIGHSEFQAIVAQVIEAALAARPAPEAGSVVERLRERSDTHAELKRIGGQAEAWPELFAEAADLIQSQAEKIERLEQERDGALKAHDIIVGSALKWRDRLLVSEARASELQRDVERLREAIKDALGRHQVTHIHAGLRAAIKQEGESDV